MRKFKDIYTNELHFGLLHMAVVLIYHFSLSVNLISNHNIAHYGHILTSSHFIDYVKLLLCTAKLHLMAVQRIHNISM